MPSSNMDNCAWLKLTTPPSARGQTKRPRLVEEQINEKLVTAYLQPVLTPDEREPSAQLEKEACYVLRERTFGVALLGILGQAEDVEDIGILERFPCEIGPCRIPNSPI